MNVSATPMTFEEFERLPDHPGKLELVNGELVELPVAPYKQTRTRHRIHELLDAALEQAHGRGEAGALGEVFMRMGYYLRPDGWLQPDVSITRAGQVEGKYLEESPAIAVEVTLPEHSAEQMVAKVVEYVAHGAREVWLIHPNTGQAYIYVGDQIRVLRKSEAITTPLLPGFALLLEDVL